MIVHTLQSVEPPLAGLMMFPIDRRPTYRDAKDHFSEENTLIAGKVNPPGRYFGLISHSSVVSTPIEKGDWQPSLQEHSHVTAKETSYSKLFINHHSIPASNSKPKENHPQPSLVNEKTNIQRACQSQTTDKIQLPEDLDREPNHSTSDEDSLDSGILDDEIWFYGETESSVTKSRQEEDTSSVDSVGGSLASYRNPNNVALQDLPQIPGNMTGKHGRRIKSFPLTSLAIKLGEDSGSKNIVKFAEPREETAVKDAALELNFVLKRLKLAMIESTKSQQSLQRWDRKNGLPASHCQTMVNSARSREQLLSGMVLQKWNGVPLLMLPGARVKVTRRQFRGVKVAEIE